MRYRYKQDNALGIQDREQHVGFIAQEVERVIPEAVSMNSRGYREVSNDPILWTMLNAIQQPQEQIAAQQQRIERLEKLLEQRLDVQVSSAATRAR